MIAITQATVADAQGIAEVHVRTWQQAYHGQLPDAYLDSLSVEDRTKKWTDDLSKKDGGITYLIARDENQVVGFCNFGRSRDEDEMENVGEIYAIYVLPEYQGKGLGTALLTKGVESLKNQGYSQASLWVLESNTKTRNFYEHHGWICEGTKKTEHKKDVDLHEIRYIITQ